MKAEAKISRFLEKFGRESEIVPCTRARWRRPAFNSVYCERLDQWISDKVCLYCTERNPP